MKLKRIGWKEAFATLIVGTIMSFFIGRYAGIILIIVGLYGLYVEIQEEKSK